MTRAPLYRHKLYGGFVEGKLYIGLTIAAGVFQPAIFTSKAVARKHFEEVREVEVREVRK